MDKVKNQTPLPESPSVQTQQPPEQPSVNPPCCSKAFLIVAIGILVVILGSGGFFLAIKGFQTNLPSVFPPITSKPTPLPSITSATEGDPTANWKMYFLQSNFEVKYPPNWDFYKLMENNITFGPRKLVAANRERLDNPDTGALIGGKAWPVEVKPLTGNSYFYSSNEVSFVSDGQKKVISEEVIINGIKAVSYIIVFNYDAPYISKGDIIEVVVARKGAKTYSITLSDQKYKDIFDQILSTFKFTN
ncbi:MAG: hypothetical protein Q8P89_04670 [bacterium]|nr:hypothetical protein [bacterium]